MAVVEATDPSLPALPDVQSREGERVTNILRHMHEHVIDLKVDDLSSDCRVLHVRRAVWEGKEQSPKTENAIRSVDLPEPMAAFLRRHVAGRLGYVFTTRLRRPLSAQSAADPARHRW